ncbi:MAG: hypothetical protein ACRBCI_12325 [Cellvibrionaceae bacterium]
MKALKIIIGIVVTLIIIVAIVFGVGLSQLNSIVERVIEEVGTDTLKTSVNVSAVDITLTEGKGVINGLSVNNPQGYSNNKLLSVGDVGLQIDIESLTNNVKVIKQVYVKGVKLRAEQKNLTDTNIQALIDNLKSQSSNTSGASKSKSGDDVLLMIEKLQFGESEIALETEKYGGKTIKLPGYTQTNIGSKSKGLTPDQVSQVIMKSLLDRVKKSVKNELKKIAKDEVKEKIGKEKDKLKDKLKEKVGDKISSDDVDKLKNLFK